MNFDERTSISDLTWNLVPYYGAKAEGRTLSDIRRYDRFTTSSRVSQKNFLIIEKFFQDYLNDVDFVELSPLQPLGVNCVLAKTNGKKIIPTIRGQEIISDATTALFLEAYKNMGSNKDIRLATNVRTVRPKIFNDESKFLPHFKVFAEITLGRQAPPFGKNEVIVIARHLLDELSILNSIRANTKNNIAGFKVYISNLFFLRNILSSVTERKSQNDVVEAKNIWEKLRLPAQIALNNNTTNELKNLGFHNGIRILEMFLATLFGQKDFYSNVNVSWLFDLSRSAGINYYRHIAYKITAVSNDGLELPLADGGSNDWGAKISNDKQLFTVSSGVGTELLIQNFLKLA
jgi:hypothetical protein